MLASGFHLQMERFVGKRISICEMRKTFRHHVSVPVPSAHRIHQSIRFTEEEKHSALSMRDIRWRNGERAPFQLLHTHFVSFLIGLHIHTHKRSVCNVCTPERFPMNENKNITFAGLGIRGNSIL